MQKKTKKRIGVAAMALIMAGAIGATAGTTLARYISSTTVTSQSATVAKWGYTLSANADELFGEFYTPDETGTVAKVAEKVKDSVVVSSEANNENVLRNVVAPGTTGWMTLTINGSAEVDAQLVIKVSDFATVWLDYNNDTYYPLVWKVNNTTVANTKETTAANNFATAIATAIEAADDYLTAVATGDTVTVDLPDNIAVSLSLTISWEWKFTDGTESKDLATNETNIKDTILGQLAFGTQVVKTPAEGETEATYYTSGTDYSLDTKFGLSATVAQVQYSSGSGLDYPKN